MLTDEDLKSKKIDSKKITKISEQNSGADIINQITEDTIIYVIKPDKEIFNIVVALHLMLKFAKTSSESIIFVPKENYDIIEYMSTNNMLSEFHIENFNIDLIPIDIDLFSMEKENNIKEMFIEKNLSCMSDLANAVVKLENCFGKISHKYIKGDLAKTFCNLVEEKEKENDITASGEEILGMIVLDRSVDFIPLMTTNYTCEGLIDEFIGINLGRIDVKRSILFDLEKIMKEKNKGKDKSKKKEEPIDGNKTIRFALTTDVNPLYCSFRCMNYILGIQYIAAVKNYYGDLTIKSQGNRSLVELADLTDEIKKYTNVRADFEKNERLLDFVINSLKDEDLIRYREKEQILLSGEMPERLHEFYDEHLCQQKDLIKLIKLMIIESLTQNGIEGYPQLKREIINIYGFQKIFLFRDLENLGWLKEKTKLKNLKHLINNFSYSQLKEKLDLVSESFQNKIYDDCSYVLMGFSPVSLKLIEKAVYGQWASIGEILSKMPGETSFPGDENVIRDPLNDKNIMFIVFLGGITYTEIEAIRFLNRKFNLENLQGQRKKTQFIILTTSILNSGKVLDSLGKNVNSALNMKSFMDEESKNK